MGTVLLILQFCVVTLMYVEVLVILCGWAYAFKLHHTSTIGIHNGNRVTVTCGGWEN